MDMKEVGLRIKKFRKSKGMTQKELANIINKGETSITRYEKGDVQIPANVLERIANALDVSYSDLTGIINVNVKITSTATARVNVNGQVTTKNELLIQSYLKNKFPDEYELLNEEDFKKIYELVDNYVEFNFNKIIEKRKEK